MVYTSHKFTMSCINMLFWRKYRHHEPMEFRYFIASMPLLIPQAYRRFLSAPPSLAGFK